MKFIRNKIPYKVCTGGMYHTIANDFPMPQINIFPLYCSVVYSLLLPTLNRINDFCRQTCQALSYLIRYMAGFPVNIQ